MVDNVDEDLLNIDDDFLGKTEDRKIIDIDALDVAPEKGGSETGNAISFEESIHIDGPSNLKGDNEKDNAMDGLDAASGRRLSAYKTPVQKRICFEADSIWPWKAEIIWEMIWDDDVKKDKKVGRVSRVIPGGQFHTKKVCQNWTISRVQNESNSDMSIAERKQSCCITFSDLDCKADDVAIEVKTSSVTLGPLHDTGAPKRRMYECLPLTPWMRSILEYLEMVFPSYIRLFDQIMDLIVVANLIEKQVVASLLLLVICILSSTIRWFVSLREVQNYCDFKNISNCQRYAVMLYLFPILGVPLHFVWTAVQAVIQRPLTDTSDPEYEMNKREFENFTELIAESIPAVIIGFYLLLEESNEMEDIILVCVSTGFGILNIYRTSELIAKQSSRHGYTRLEYILFRMQFADSVAKSLIPFFGGLESNSATDVNYSLHRLNSTDVNNLDRVISPNVSGTIASELKNFQLSSFTFTNLDFQDSYRFGELFYKRNLSSPVDLYLVKMRQIHDFVDLWESIDENGNGSIERSEFDQFNGSIERDDFNGLDDIFNRLAFNRNKIYMETMFESICVYTTGYVPLTHVDEFLLYAIKSFDKKVFVWCLGLRLHLDEDGSSRLFDDIEVSHEQGKIEVLNIILSVPDLDEPQRVEMISLALQFDPEMVTRAISFYCMKGDEKNIQLILDHSQNLSSICEDDERVCLMLDLIKQGMQNLDRELKGLVDTYVCPCLIYGSKSGDLTALRRFISENIATFENRLQILQMMNKFGGLDIELQNQIVQSALRVGDHEVLDDLSLAVESLNIEYDNAKMKKFLVLLCRSGNQKCLIWCINNGLDLNMHVNSERDTLLHVAIRSSEGALALTFITCGARWNVPNSDAYTPFSMLMNSEDPVTMEYRRKLKEERDLYNKTSILQRKQNSGTTTAIGQLVENFVDGTDIPIEKVLAVWETFASERNGLGNEGLISVILELLQSARSAIFILAARHRSQQLRRRKVLSLKAGNSTNAIIVLNEAIIDYARKAGEAIVRCNRLISRLSNSQGFLKKRDPSEHLNGGAGPEPYISVESLKGLLFPLTHRSDFIHNFSNLSSTLLNKIGLPALQQQLPLKSGPILEESDEEFDEDDVELTQKRREAILIVKVVGAECLKPEEGKETCSPYCILHVGKQKLSTIFIDSSNNPEWSQKFRFTRYRFRFNESRQGTLYVMDWIDEDTGAHLVGFADFKIPDMYIERPQQVDLTLRDNNDEVRGYLIIEITLEQKHPEFVTYDDGGDKVALKFVAVEDFCDQSENKLK